MAATPRPGFSLEEATTALTRTPAVLDALLQHQPAAALDADEGPGTWSPLQVLRHLTDAEEGNWIPRLRLILTHGPRETFPVFDREAGFVRLGHLDVGALLTEFRRLRDDNVRALEGLRLDQAGLALEGRHPTFGRVTLQQLVACWVTHDLAHLDQISRVLVRFHGAHVGPWRAFFRLLQP